MGIFKDTDFLHSTSFLYLKFRNIGFANELPLLGLANRLMAIKDEDKAIEAIMQCLEESRIKTDESKKISIIANYRYAIMTFIPYIEGYFSSQKQLLLSV